MWSMEIGKLSQTEIKDGVRLCIEEGLEWPPSLPKFVELCTRIDSEDAFWRMIEQKPCESQAEKVTRERVGYQCRSMYSEEKARKVFAKEYAENVKRERRGQLAQPLKALPKDSAVTEIDKRISDRIGKPTTAIEQRMAKIMKARHENQ